MEKYIYNQKESLKISGIPLAYWLSEDVLSSMNNLKVSDYSYNKAGVVSGDDNYFVRYWFEPLFSDINMSSSTYPHFSKYHIFCKGGDFRRYYGNYWHVIKLHDLYDEKLVNKSVRRGDKDSYFKKCISWSIIGSSNVKSFRCVENSVCGTASPSIYVLDESNFYYILGLVNSKYGELIINAVNPTLNLQSSDVGAIPVIMDSVKRPYVDELVLENINICKEEWDSYETSMNFKKHPLI